MAWRIFKKSTCDACQRSFAWVFWGPLRQCRRCNCIVCDDCFDYGDHYCRKCAVVLNAAEVEMCEIDHQEGRRIEQAPARLDALEARVKKLEEGK